MSKILIGVILILLFIFNVKTDSFYNHITSKQFVEYLNIYSQAVVSNTILAMKEAKITDNAYMIY